MKQVISVFLYLFAFESSACEINSTSQIISLSGPITHLLYELKLLKAPVIGISEFHGIAPEEFLGKIFKGGLFLSPQVLRNLKQPVIFFDESLEQRKAMTKLELKGIELITKNQDPFEVYDLSKKKLVPFLKQCEVQLAQIDLKVLKVKELLQKSRKRDGFYFFYLGEIQKNKRKPNLIMIDSFILSLQKLSIIKTYPSQLNYIPWAEKVVNEYQSKKTFSIGLVTARPMKHPRLEVKAISENEFNLYHPALLVPGIAQINFLQDLLEKLP